MAIPTSGYPTTLDDTSASPGVTIEFPQPASSSDLDATNIEHDLLHTNGSLAVVVGGDGCGAGAHRTRRAKMATAMAAPVIDFTCMCTPLVCPAVE